MIMIERTPQLNAYVYLAHKTNLLGMKNSLMRFNDSSAVYLAGDWVGILWNAVTSLGENKVIYHPLPHTSFSETHWRHSVKSRLYKNPPPYFFVWDSSAKTKEVEVIEFHIIWVITGLAKLLSMFSALNQLDTCAILWNLMTLTSFVFTELANTMKYGGGGVLHNLLFTEWRHCASQNEVWERGCYRTLSSPSDVTAFHRI